MTHQTFGTGHLGVPISPASALKRELLIYFDGDEERMQRALDYVETMGVPHSSLAHSAPSDLYADAPVIKCADNPLLPPIDYSRCECGERPIIRVNRVGGLCLPCYRVWFEEEAGFPCPM